jgi:redox-sensitive bicupin YhaK (pirin superfamily)
MITLRRSQERGHADHGWLDAYHTFSFADYYDPDHVHFGALRVLNQDRVAPASGFPTHPHRDMEIVTYVLEGALEHKDSMGNGSRILPGEVQFMSAGTGVLHSEKNPSRTDPLHLLQMWIFPREKGTAPSYDQRQFPLAERSDRLRLVVSPDGRDGSIRIGQDADLYAAVLSKGARVEQALAPGRAAWLHVARGRVALNGTELGPGDGAAIHAEPKLTLQGLEEAELVLWDLAED